MSEGAPIRSAAGCLTRSLGIVLGGGVGFLIEQLLSGLLHVDVRYVLALPGLGLALGAGLFGVRWRWGWGVTCALLAPVWVIATVWLRRATEWSLADAGQFVASTAWGSFHLFVAAVAGFTFGAGWAPRRTRNA